MDYSQETQDKIDYLCKLAERKSYKLDKKKAKNALLESYDLFGLKRPRKIKWHTHLDEVFASSVYSAYRASSASSASRASRAFSAYRAFRAFSASRAYSAFSASRAYSVSSAYSAYSAYSASNAYRASSASSDYDFDYGICVFEYIKNPSMEEPNENDYKYLEFFKLMIEAKKYGAGYFCDYEDILYIVPVPIIRCDEEGRYHSETHPAVSWDGEKVYYLKGVKLEKKWWDKIRKDKLSSEEVFAIGNLEHRRIAYEYMDKRKMKKLKDFKVLDEDTDDKGNPMKIISFNVQEMEEDLIFYNCFCPLTKREYFIQTKHKNCKDAKSMSFGLNKIKWINEW